MSLRNVVLVAVSTLSMTAFAQRTPPAAEQVDPASLRPEEMTVGVGAGWTFPRSILEPNAVSVRLKFGALAIEPVLSLGGSSGGAASTISGTNIPEPIDAEDTTGGLNLGIGGNVRYTLGSAGPVDFVGIGGLGFNYGQSTVNDDVHLEDQTDRTTTTGLNANLNWGIGVEWFITRNVVLSADATNPLVSWNQTTTLNETSNTAGATPVSNSVETVQRTLNYGLIIQPTVRMMFHLYF